jgi:hypothetical protein
MTMTKAPKPPPLESDDDAWLSLRDAAREANLSESHLRLLLRTDVGPPSWPRAHAGRTARVFRRSDVRRWANGRRAPDVES